MNCINCGAPLPPKSQMCEHCQTLNDVDLRAIETQPEKQAPSPRMCPRCGVRLHTIDLQLGGSFLIERCDKCLGLFFDPGELEQLVDRTVKHVYKVDHERLNRLITEEYASRKYPIRYIKCPVCGTMMNRATYGRLSGMVVDQCRAHGVWFDGGELGQLLKWIKAGGKIHEADRAAEDERNKEHRRRVEKRTETTSLSATPSVTGSTEPQGLVDFLLSLLR